MIYHNLNLDILKSNSALSYFHINRAKFSWQDRSHDFDLLKKPKEYFGEPSPVTIYLAGDTLAKEQRQAADEERKVWERSLVVDNTILKTYR